MIQIQKNPKYAESNITFVGITQNAYGRPQYILVNSDEGNNDLLKFPGLRFRSADSSPRNLESLAEERFKEQTGLEVTKSLGLRAIMPTRSRHGGSWIFRNIFFGVIENPFDKRMTDGRKVYVADIGQGTSEREDSVSELVNSGKKQQLNWVAPDNMVVARIATEFTNHFDWHSQEGNWYRKIPCLANTRTLVEDYSGGELGCALAVSSIMLLYQPSPGEPRQIILVKRKGDKSPGYAGGKIETLDNPESRNLDPISCCAIEGSEEFGFEIQPRGLIGVANTSLDVPKFGDFYNSIVNYAFVAEPTNPAKVREALKNPEKFLEGKMECYVVENLDCHRDRIAKEELRMPDMPVVGKEFYRTSPADKIPLNHIIPSGLI